MENPRGSKRILRRCCQELRAAWEISRVTSLGGGLVSLLGKLWIQIMNRNGFREPDRVRKLLLKKHAVMLDYFEKTMEFPHRESHGTGNEAGPIWLCWWQGAEAAPEIVKACVSSVYAHAGSRQVILVTEETYRQYTAIPEWAVEKFRRGVISPTHFSDILRLSLLAEHGGIWLDAPVYCCGRPEQWDAPLWTIKRPGYLHCSVAAGSFATYGMGCRENRRWIFGVFRDLLLDYWQKNDLLMDYLLLDYLMVLAQRHCPGMAQALREVRPNQPECDELCKVLAEPFDEEAWLKMKANTQLFKLTWKQSFPVEKNGKPTFYAMVLEGKL